MDDSRLSLAVFLFIHTTVVLILSVTSGDTLSVKFNYVD